MEDEYTTIRIQKTTRKALADIGKKGETYDAVILKLLQFWATQYGS